MSVLDQIKERMAYYVDLWQREPRETSQNIDTLLTFSGTTQRIKTPLVTCKECRFKAPDGDWCYREAHEFAVEPDGFCSSAERRDT